MRIILLCLLLCSCAPPDPVEPTSESLVGGATFDSFVRGRDEFNHQTMGGNGRVCASCHTTPERAADIGYRWGVMHGQTQTQATITALQFAQRYATFDLSPEFARLVFEVDPNDGLFRSIDSQGGVGANFENTLFKGLVRVGLTLHSSVHVQDCGPANECTVLPDGRHRIIVHRGSPTSLNQALFDGTTGETAGHPFQMQDGRRQAGSEDQAAGAFDDHFERTLTPTPLQLSDIADFEQNTFSDVPTALYAALNIDPGLPACHTESECRGMEFFRPQHISASDMGHRGLCAQCHSGPMGNHSSIWHKFQFPRPPLPSGGCPCSDGTAPVGGVCARSVVMAGPFDPPHEFDPPGVDSPPLCFHRVSAPGPECPHGGCANPDPAARFAALEAAGMRVRTFIYSDVPPAVDPPGVMIGGVQVPLAPPGLPWGPRTFIGHDPGRGGLTGDPCNEFPLLCLFAPPGQVLGHNFRIASLRGAGRRQHFDHNNVDLTPEEQCADVFRGLAAQVPFFQSIGDPDALAFVTTEQDIIDCGAALRLF